MHVAGTNVRLIVLGHVCIDEMLNDLKLSGCIFVYISYDDRNSFLLNVYVGQRDCLFEDCRIFKGVWPESWIICFTAFIL